MSTKSGSRFYQREGTHALLLSDSDQSEAPEPVETPTPCYQPLPMKTRTAGPTGERKRACNDAASSDIRFLTTKRAKCEDRSRPARQYPEGVFKKVRVLDHVRCDDITLPEVLDIPMLQEAVVSSFAWDLHWLLGEIGLGWVNTTFIADNRGRDSWARQTSLAPRGTRNTQRWHFPPRHGKGCAHSKLMLLFRKDDTMRIVIPTGNLRRADWGAPPPTCGQLLSGTGQSLDNVVFMIDVPLKQGPIGEDEDSEIPFQRELQKYLEGMDVPSDIVQHMLRYDFSACTPYQFVWSGDASRPYSGLFSLANAVGRLGCKPLSDATIQVDYTTSSLGRLTKNFRARLWCALGGQYYNYELVPGFNRIRHSFEIRFPSARSASSAPNSKRRLDLHSLDITPGSEEEHFLDAALIDNAPGALLSHAKVLRVQWQKGNRAERYVCVTSANLAPTAWGSSWECGVLVAGRRGDAVEISDGGFRYGARNKWM